VSRKVRSPPLRCRLSVELPAVLSITRRTDQIRLRTIR
jgi:electron transfer flavoprotein alpha/beta subunit